MVPRLQPVEVPRVVDRSTGGADRSRAHVMRVIIVDTEVASRRTLRELCAHEPDVDVVAEFSDSVVALEAARASPPDVLFLNVHMTPLSGVAFAKALESFTPTHIVFISAHDRFARDAFDGNATDFLVKPLDGVRFRYALTRIRRRLDLERLAKQQLGLSDVLQQVEQSTRTLCQPRRRIIADSGGRMHVLDVGDIELIESEKNYVTLTVGRDRYTARCTLLHAEAAMASQRMLRISRSRLVNLTHVREIGRTPRGDVIVLLAGGVAVTTSERYRHSVRQELGRIQLNTREG